MDIIEKTIHNLKRNKIKSRLFISAENVIDSLETLINNGSKVGVGDSVTLETLGIYNYLRSRNILFLDKYDPSLQKEQKKDLYIQNFSADFFIASANAITSTGKIYHLDGNGSRVAPMIYGPKKVILICGVNKIVATDADAINRIEETAAPLDAKRLEKNTPCVRTGKCAHCKSIDKICNYYTIIQGQFDANRIEVWFVQGEYGY